MARLRESPDFQVLRKAMKGGAEKALCTLLAADSKDDLVMAWGLLRGAVQVLEEVDGKAGAAAELAEGLTRQAQETRESAAKLTALRQGRRIQSGAKLHASLS